MKYTHDNQKSKCIDYIDSKIEKNAMYLYVYSSSVLLAINPFSHDFSVYLIVLLERVASTIHAVVL